MVKHSGLVWNNVKSQRTILHAHGYALPYTSINQGQEGITKLYIMFKEFFKESDRVNPCKVVAMTHQREEWNHQHCGSMVIDMEDINS